MEQYKLAEPLIGHFSDEKRRTGCTVILFPAGAVYGVSIKGHASSLRQVSLSDQMHVVSIAHAVFFTGGSAYGLDAAGGVMKFLSERGIGLKVGSMVVPSVPTAAIYDLNFSRGKAFPDRTAGYDACLKAFPENPAQGSVGAGSGATVGKTAGIENAMKGGLGIAAAEMKNGVRVGALSVVNAFGDILENGKIIAGALTKDNEFADSSGLLAGGALSNRKIEPYNTTLIAVYTDAALNRLEAAFAAEYASQGFAASIRPCHTMLDGDSCFFFSYGKKRCDIHALAETAKTVVSRSIVNAVRYAAVSGAIKRCGDLL
ncbi:MAG: P1 family peptidase [Deltaproteobacteria bacterium]|nr:P1 family peptidase [Deltaproteobacteria bacterium]